jgi:hypothetical protein
MQLAPPPTTTILEFADRDEAGQGSACFSDEALPD